MPLRSALLVIGLAILAVAALSMPFRISLLSFYNLLTFVALTTIAVALLPDNRFKLAPVIALAVVILLWAMNRAKIAAVGLPISYLDLVIVWQQPNAFLSALGYKGNPWLVWGLASAIGVSIAAGMLARIVPRVDMRRMSRWIAESTIAIALSVYVVEAAARDINERTNEIFPDLVPRLWEPAGQRALLSRSGPLVYTAFTRLAGDGRSVELSQAKARDRPLRRIDAAASAYVDTRANAASPHPNIVIYHAESAFDPNAIFRLSRPVRLRLWTRDEATKSLGPLRVNPVGGGSWITEFEILTGIDARPFGYLGYYTHMALGPRAAGGFPGYLGDRGFVTRAYYTANGDYMGIGKAFANYGVSQFIGSDRLGLAGDWSESDVFVVKAAMARGGFETSEKPLFLFISSQENHGPHHCRHFNSQDQLVTRFAGGAPFKIDCSLNEYLRRAASTSRAADLILEQLRRLEAETGRPFVLLIYGDHQPYSFTDGVYTTAGGTAVEAGVSSIARYRRGRNHNLTFFHLRASQGGRVPASFEIPIPATLIPSLLSAYVARDNADLYRPVNFLAFRECGSDSLAAGCPLADDLALWARDDLLGK
jgi:hypothetical protein